ncbi:DUF6884 domain-containing protein [Amycolatopsis sp. NPDC059021]|uniref:DUF6884 domain-containing protein n=1 Tax=Amycolatopsis sp. NPDC059021 TaxID=3346704 RepID=UPI0036735700
MTTNTTTQRLVIVGCSPRKATTTVPLPALELYQDWWFPRLRQAVRACRWPRANVLVLSGQHGLIPADTPLLPYDQPLTPDRADLLRDPVQNAFQHHLTGVARYSVLLLLAPDYLALLAPALSAAPPASAHWFPDPDTCWDDAVKVLATWSRHLNPQSGAR